MSVDLLPGEQCFCSVLLPEVAVWYLLLPAVQCCIIAWTSTLLLLCLLGGLAVLVVTLGCCPVFRPSCVRDVVVGVGLALALHPPVVCLAIFDSS